MAGQTGKVVPAETALRQKAHPGKGVIHAAPPAGLSGQAVLENGGVLSRVVRQPREIPGGGEGHRLRDLGGVLRGVPAVLDDGPRRGGPPGWIRPDVGRETFCLRPPLF